MNPSNRPGQRICVVGTSGSGKTTVAQALARKLGLTYVSNDAQLFGEDWYQVPGDEVADAFDRLLQADGWTFDGNIGLGESRQDAIPLQRCDTFVWLDLPRWQVHCQIAWRSLRRVITKEPLWHGNRETWRITFSRDSVTWWSIKTFAKRRRQYGALFADPAYGDKTLIRLQSRGEVARWLTELPPS